MQRPTLTAVAVLHEVVSIVVSIAFGLVVVRASGRLRRMFSFTRRKASSFCSIGTCGEDYRTQNDTH